MQTHALVNEGAWLTSMEGSTVLHAFTEYVHPLLPNNAVVVQVVETAAPQGKGLQQLEEALLFQAELMELAASPSRPALGVVVEARMDKGQGAVATVIIRRGTLKAGLHPSC